MKNDYYVYEHWRPDTDECFYVGKGRDRRAYSRKNRNPHWKNIVAKLASQSLAHDVKIVAEGLTEGSAYAIEIERIGIWKDGATLCNILPGGVNGGGGMSGRRHTEETRAKMRLAQKGREITEEAREKLRLANLGKKASDEAREKMSAARRGRKLAPEHAAKIGDAHRGKTVSAEVCAKLSALATGRKHSSETKAKIGEISRARKGQYKHPIGAVEKMREARLAYWAKRRVAQA